MKFLTFVNAFIEIQLISLGVLLILRKTGNASANKFLGIHVLLLALVLMPGVLIFMDKLRDFRLFINLDHALGYALPPVLYLYAQVLLSGKISSKRWRMLHFLPATLSLVYSLSFHFQSEDFQIQYIEELNQSVNTQFGHILIYTYFGHFLVYLYFILRMVSAYKKKKGEKLSSVEKLNLRWLTTLNISVTMMNVYLVFLTLSGNTPERFALFILLSLLVYYYFIVLLIKHPSELHQYFNSSLSGVQNISHTQQLDCHYFNTLINQKISEREFEVLQLMIEGCTNVEISEKLFISVNTIKKHVASIYKKLNVNNRVEATKLVLRHTAGMVLNTA